MIAVELIATCESSTETTDGFGLITAQQRLGVGMKAGWRVTKLGEVCEIIMGQSPDGESYNTTGEGVPLINGPVEFSKGSFGNTVKSKFTTQPTKFCKTGDLILCVRGSTTGKMNIAGFDACIGRGVAAIRAKQYQPWINHFISSKRDEIHGKGTGATFPNVSGAMVADFEICMPPIPEQQRIVTVLDEAFDGIATAKLNAEKNLQNARAIFESHLQAVFTQRGDGWFERTLGNTYDVRDGTHDSPKYHDNGFPLITSKNLKRDGLSFDDVRLIDVADYRKINERSAVHKGDVLLAMIGTIGNPVVVETEPAFAIKNVALLKVPAGQNSHFLRYYLSSQFVVDKMQSEAKGTTQKFVGLGYLRSFPIMVPSGAEQASVVCALDELSTETNRLEEIYQQKLTALDELKKSLLHRAFNGDL